MKTAPLSIYSIRFSGTRGWTAYNERACSDDYALEWLNVFKADEPNVYFMLSRKKPTPKQIAAIVENGLC